MAHYKQDAVIAERYEVKQIRRGGMGIVYLCFDHNTQLPIALKSFQDQFLDTWQVRDRFNQEILTWIQLGKHPHIVQAYRAEFIDGKPFAIVELISGPPGIQPDLRSWLVHRRVDTKRALEIAIQICRGMQYANQKVPGIVHRDLKPENVLLTAEGTAKITDFGLAKVAQASQQELAMLSSEEVSLDLEHAGFTKMKGIVGTPQYMAPEQWRREELDLRTDIYALGCILFEMLTGQMVFQATTLQELESLHTNRKPPSLQASNDQISSDLDALVGLLLHKNCDQRPIDFSVIQEQLVTIYLRLFDKTYEGIKISDVQNTSEKLDNARTLLNLGHYAEGDGLIDEVLALEPDNWKAWSNKGIILLETRNLVRAEECVNRSLDIKPARENEAALNQKGIIYLLRNDLPQAIHIFDEVLYYHPQSIPAMINKFIVLCYQQRLPQAKQLLNDILKRDPLNWNALFNKAAFLSTDVSELEYTNTWLMALRASITSEQRLRVLSLRKVPSFDHVTLRLTITLLEQILDQLTKDLSDNAWKQISKNILDGIVLNRGSRSNEENVRIISLLIGINPDNFIHELTHNVILGMIIGKMYYLGIHLRLAEKLKMYDTVKQAILKLDVEVDELCNSHANLSIYISKLRGIFYYFVLSSTSDEHRRAELRSRIDSNLWIHSSIKYIADIILALAQEDSLSLELLENIPSTVSYPKNVEELIQPFFEFIEYPNYETFFAAAKLTALYYLKQQHTNEMLEYANSLSPEIQNCPQIMHLKAETLYHLNREDEAILILQEALSKKPKNSADLQKTLLLCEAKKRKRSFI